MSDTKATHTAARYTIKANPSSPLGPSVDILRPDGTSHATLGGPDAEKRAKREAAMLNDAYQRGWADARKVEGE